MRMNGIEHTVNQMSVIQSRFLERAIIAALTFILLLAFIAPLATPQGDIEDHVMMFTTLSSLLMPLANIVVISVIAGALVSIAISLKGQRQEMDEKNEE